MKANVIVTKTAKGMTRIINAENKRKLDKCTMSFYFPSYTYFGIYWYSANYEEMCKAFLELPNVTIVNK